MKRPQDGVFTKFTGEVMDKVCALTPDFTSYEDAAAFYRKLLRRKKVKTLLALRFNGREEIQNVLTYTTGRYDCAFQAMEGPYLREDRHNPMEILHLFAHIVQPPDSAMHKGEFGKIFLTLVESVYDAEMKRKVKDILIEHNIKTSTRSPETRQKQAAAW